MTFLLYFTVFLFILVCLFLIGVVLLQQGKSADLASAFGGQGTQTAFGPRGTANLFTRLTPWSAVLFMVLAIVLTVMFSRASSRSVLTGTHTSLPAKK